MRRETLSTCILLSQLIASMMLGALTFVLLCDPIVVEAQGGQDSARFWAVLVHGPLIDENDTDYMYHILDEHYNFTIYYLHTNTSHPRVNNASTKENVQWAINTWLPSQSNENDTILIFFDTYGGGYQLYTYIPQPSEVIREGLQNGRWDFDDPDEGDEHPESDIKLPNRPPDFHFDKRLRLNVLVDADGDDLEDDVYRNHDADPYIELDLNNDGMDWYEDVLTELHDYDMDGVNDDLLIDPKSNDKCDIAINANVSLTSDGEDEDNDGYIDRVDFNEDGDYDDYVGVDECLILIQLDKYWDDEIKTDLNNLEGKYETLIFMTQSCVKGNLSCYGGGLIDDLSQENSSRIIMTASNETSVAHADLDDDGYCEWVGPFMHALHGIVDADNNTDGHISMREAWQYAWDHDTPRQARKETPWLDDDSNGLPTFANGTDVGSPLDDGELANATWFPKIVSHLEVDTSLTTGGDLDDVDFWLDDNETALQSPEFLHVTATNHTVEVDDHFEIGNYSYDFHHWNLENSTSNPITVDVSQDVHLTAYYERSLSGCPFVYTWNGTDYVIDNNLLPASETSGGTDVEDYYRLEQALVPKYEGQWSSWYSLQIREFEQEHSYFDKVKLLAVDHESDVDVAVSPTGEILTFQDPNEPVSAVDRHGNDMLDLLQEVDENYYEGHAGDYLLLDFGDLNIEYGAKLVMRADFPPKEEKWSIFVQVLNDTGSWETVATVIPRVYWATEIVDLQSCLPDVYGDLKVRLYFTRTHRIDYVGLDTSEQADFVVHDGILVSAMHSQEGSVLLELLFKDSYYAELVPSEHIELTFILPKQGSATRTFVIYSKGHYFRIP